MNNLLNSYDDKFYIFDSKPKMKMLIIRKNNYIDDYYLNDLEYKSFDNINGKEKRGPHLNDDKESYSFYNYILDVFSSLRYQDVYRLKKYKYNLLEIELHAKMYTEHISREYIDRLLGKGYELTKGFFEFNLKD